MDHHEVLRIIRDDALSIRAKLFNIEWLAHEEITTEDITSSTEEFSGDTDNSQPRECYVDLTKLGNPTEPIDLTKSSNSIE